LWTIALCTRFVVNCSRSARAADRGHVAGSFDGDALLFREREERFGGFFRDEGQVDVFSGEGPLIGAAEQEQGFREVDRPGVDGVEAIDEFVDVTIWIVAGHVEQGPRDRQRRAQFVGGVGGEPLLLGDVRFESRQHGVERVGKFPELVFAPVQLDPVGKESVCGHARGVRDARQRREHAAGENPSSQEAERQQERQHDGRGRRVRAPENPQRRQNVAPNDESVGRQAAGVDNRAVGRIPQEEHPDGGEQQGAGEHEEAGVAEGEPEANAQPRRSIHGPLSHRRCLAARRCGTRLPPRWR
jgi:hypothetical protein